MLACGACAQEDRAEAVAALAAAQERHAALTAECAKHAASDPATLKRIADMKKVALEAANRWTDNRACALRAATASIGVCALR